MGIVAPLVGAWIETSNNDIFYNQAYVAPLVGAWIETLNGRKALQTLMSLPSWERGLKQTEENIDFFSGRVAPLVGAWIETPPIWEET